MIGDIVARDRERDRFRVSRFHTLGHFTEIGPHLFPCGDPALHKQVMFEPPDRASRAVLHECRKSRKATCQPLDLIACETSDSRVVRYGFEKESRIGGRKGAAVVAYSPFGHGHFPDERSPGGRVLAEIAAAHDATPRQIALAFLTHRAFVIPKASSPEHAAENARAGDLKLSESELARIDAAFPRGPKPAVLPTI